MHTGGWFQVWFDAAYQYVTEVYLKGGMLQGKAAAVMLWDDLFLYQDSWSTTECVAGFGEFEECLAQLLWNVVHSFSRRGLIDYVAE